MLPSRLLPLLMVSALVTTGCTTTTPTVEDLDRLQAPESSASRAKNLMKAFDFNVYDREAEGRGQAVTADEITEDNPFGKDLTKERWGMPSVSGMLDASVLAQDPLKTVHYFGYMPVELALDERAVVRRSAALAVEKVARVMKAEGWRFAWTRPKSLQMSLGYSVTQDVFFEKEGTTCRIPENVESLQPGAAKGCVVRVDVRSQDVSQGKYPDATGFEPVPRWIDDKTPLAWHIRNIALFSNTPEGKPFLTTDRQRALALATGRWAGFYGFDEQGVPYLGWEGEILRFEASDAARETVANEKAKKAVPITDKMMGEIKSWWPLN